MDFVRSYFGTNETLTSWTLFSSLFVQISADLENKWGQKCSTGQSFICTEVTSYKIHILGVPSLSNQRLSNLPQGASDGFRKSSVIYSSIASSMFLLSESELSTCTLEFCDPRRILAISQKVAMSFFPYITLSFKFASQTSRVFFTFYLMIVH
jgi:hypothetical protein